MNTSHLWIGIVACVVVFAIALGITRGRLDKMSWLILLVGMAAMILVVLNWNALVPHVAPAQAAPAHPTPVIHHLHGKH